MGKLEDKKHSFMNNVAIILCSQLLVKLLGLVYRMVITNIEGFGDAGNGFYNAGFQIYTLLLAISSVGIPNAISKMVSARVAIKDYKGAHRIFQTAFLLFSAIGIVASALLFFGSNFVAQVVIKMDGAQYVMRALAPSIFFVCMSSVIRGYFVGLQNMKATSTSQVLEQIFKCTLTVLFVVLSIGQPPEIMAAWANFASSAACIISFVYLIIFYVKRKSGIEEQIRQTAVKSLSVSTGRLMRNILMISVPISLSSIITAINRVIDTATITRGIAIAFSQMIPAHPGAAAILNPTAAQLNDEAVRLSGMLSKSDTLINMPLSLNIAFSTVLVPAISAALAVGNKKEASDKVTYSLLISILLIIPCAFGYIALAQPIYKLIYPAAPLGSELLQLSAIALIFTALTQTISGSLQGLGKVFVPAIALLAGCTAKIILNLLLIRQPSINIYGAAISSIACQIIAFTICFAVLCRNLTIKLGLMKYIVKPLAAGGIMAAAAYGIYRLAMIITSSNLISTIVSIALAVVIYFALVFILKVLTKDEILSLPAGAKIYGLVKRLHIYS